MINKHQPAQQQQDNLAAAQQQDKEYAALLEDNERHEVEDERMLLAQSLQDLSQPEET